jgi:hypothetical protein
MNWRVLSFPDNETLRRHHRPSAVFDFLHTGTLAGLMVREALAKGVEHIRLMLYLKVC